VQHNAFYPETSLNADRDFAVIFAVFCVNINRDLSTFFAANF